MVVSMARKFGLEKLAVPTQGNAGDSLAEYAAQAGLSAAVAMPDDTPMPIMGKVSAYSQLYPGISLDVVKGTIREAGQLIKEKYLSQDPVLMTTTRSPWWICRSFTSLESATTQAAPSGLIHQPVFL